MRPLIIRYQIFSALIVISIFGACRDARQITENKQPSPPAAIARPTPLVIPISNGFDYAVGRTGNATQAKDGDGWYTARDFGEHEHLGEDWNAESGGNTDCGLSVYAASRGTIIFAGEGGHGWGKVIIIRHRLSDDTLVETLYAHLQSFARTGGEVERRENIGSIGNADGAYPCHLHFELRSADCPAWGATGPGYNADRPGWMNPSKFIDAHRPLSSKSHPRSR